MKVAFVAYATNFADLIAALRPLKADVWGAPTLDMRKRLLTL